MVSGHQLSPLRAHIESFFKAKTAADVEATMAFFSPDLVAYIDATLGWVLPGFDALKALFEQYMPGWKPPARSYATQVRSNESSALVNMVDTPELFGGELRILAALDFADGKIIRWVDYWDSMAYDDALYAQFRTPAEQFPTDFSEAAVPTRVDARLVQAATALQEAFAAGDAAAASRLLNPDVVLADMALRTQVVGRIESARYFDRLLAGLPYGRESVLSHIVGGAHGGGFEWVAAPDNGGIRGITALDLDDDGLVTGITSVYDSRQLEPSHRSTLAAGSIR